MIPRFEGHEDVCVDDSSSTRAHSSDDARRQLDSGTTSLRDRNDMRTEQQLRDDVKDLADYARHLEARMNAERDTSIVTSFLEIIQHQRDTVGAFRRRVESANAELERDIDKSVKPALAAERALLAAKQ